MNREDTLNPFSDPSNSRESAFPLFFHANVFSQNTSERKVFYLFLLDPQLKSVVKNGLD